MRELVDTQRLSLDQAKDFLSRISKDEFRQSSLWASQMLSARVSSEVFTSSIATRMYACDYELATGILEFAFLGSRKSESVPVVFWVPKEKDSAFSNDTIDYNLNYPVVDAEKPYELVQQSFIILQAYKNGIMHRTQEVRSHVAGILGLPGDQLGQALGLNDEDD